MFNDTSFSEIIRVFILPILFVIFNGLAEMIMSISIGMAKKNETVKVTIKNLDGSTSSIITSPERLADLKARYTDLHPIIKVDILPTLNWWDYPSISP